MPSASTTWHPRRYGCRWGAGFKKKLIKEAKVNLNVLTKNALLFICLTSLAIAADTLYSPIKDYVPFTVSANGTAYARDISSRIDVCSDSMLRMYDIPSNQLRKTIRFPSRNISLITLSYSPDLLGYVIVRGDSGIYKVTISSGSIAKMYPLSTASILSVTCFSGDYSKIIYMAKDSLLHLDDSSGDSARLCFVNSNTTIHYAAFYPDNKKIITLNANDSTLRIWNANADTILVSRHLSVSISEQAGFSSRGDKIVIPLQYNNTRKYAVADASTGEILSIDSISVYGAPTTWNYGVDFQFASDDSKVMLGDFWTFTSIIDISTKKLLASYNGPGNAFYWHYNQRWFSTADTSVIIPTYHTGANFNALYELSANTGGIGVRYAKQDWPAVQYSGFSDKGQPLFVGRYYYEEYITYLGFYSLDSTVYWNAETNKEFTKRQGLTQPSTTADYVFENYFSPDGKRMFQEFWSLDAGSSGNGLYSIDIYNTADTGQLVTSVFCRSSSAVLTSQDKRSACIFDTSMVKIIDALTGDTVQMPFKLPSQWKPYTIVPTQNIVCACSTYQASQFADVKYTLGIWDLHTNALINKYFIESIDWMSNKSHGDTPRILVTPDSSRVIISSTNCTKMLDIHTGSQLVKYTNSNINIANTALTPDGNQIIIGNGCYLTSSGKLQRVYNGMSGFDYVVFNPLNNRQFIAKGKIWELPIPIAGSHSPAVQEKPRTVFCHANSRYLIIGLSSAQGEKAKIALYQPNGRRVFKKETVIRNEQEKVAFPQLSRGIYFYWFEVPSISFKSQGKIIIR
jgi:hypothetical protein